MNNDFEKAIVESKKNDLSIGAEMKVSREVQSVQAALVIAKKFPRDETEAYNRIMKSCQRKSLAEQAIYEYPRGGTKVTGPSIRLAEAIAQNWGNMEFGVNELDRIGNKSTMEAYAWDLETNTKNSMIFTVEHKRDTKQGSKDLTDSRDIYELTANMGARRKRACILAVIPGDIIDAAEEECKKTLKAGNKEPLVDSVRKMVGAFDKDFQVSKEMLEKYIGCNSDAFSDNDLIRLRGVYKSLKDGMAGREQYFDIPKPDVVVNDKVTDEFFKTKKEDKKELEDDFEGTPFAEK